MVDVNIQTTIGPYNQEPVCTRPLLTNDQLDAVVAQAVKAQKGWRKTPLDERIAIVERWMVSAHRHYSLVLAVLIPDRVREECRRDRRGHCDPDGPVSSRVSFNS